MQVIKERKSEYNSSSVESRELPEKWQVDNHQLANIIRAEAQPGIYNSVENVPLDRVVPEKVSTV